jgi:polysaccharide export outer membrane protein
MNSKSYVFFILVVFLAMVSNVFGEDYNIGAGDRLDIRVWKNNDLTQQLIVLPDGTIRFPLVGQFEVEGKSAGQLEKELIKKLEKYVSDPILSVSVVQVNSMMVYVIGKVNKPGRLTINANIDVLQALAIAGGLNPFAKEKEIGIYRKKEGKTTIYNFNYKAVAEGENLDQNIILHRGDVIVVR